jgi:hypothetical protein
MKTPEEWNEEYRDEVRRARVVDMKHLFTKFISTIQRETLADYMFQTTDQQELDMAKQIAYNERIRADQLHEQLLKMRDKWHETRRYLRQANKGAERNNMVMRLQAETIHNLLAKLKKP